MYLTPKYLHSCPEPAGTESSLYSAPDYLQYLTGLRGKRSSLLSVGRATGHAYCATGHVLQTWGGGGGDRVLSLQLLGGATALYMAYTKTVDSTSLTILC